MPTNYAGVGITFPSTVTIIADGEDLSERVLAPGIRTLADMSAYLYRKLPLLYDYTNDITSGFIYTYAGAGADETTIAAGVKVDVPGCVIGDKISVFGYFSATRVIGGNPGIDMYMDAIDDALGTPGTRTHIPGAHFGDIGTTGASNTDQNSLVGTWTVAKAGTTRICYTFNTVGSTSQDTLVLDESVCIIAIRYPL